MTETQNGVTFGAARRKAPEDTIVPPADTSSVPKEPQEGDSRPDED